MRLPGFEIIGTWRCLVCQPYAQVAFTPKELLLVLIFVRVLVDFRSILRLEILYQWKIPMTPSRIQKTTFRHVVHWVKQLLPNHSEYKTDSDSVTCKEKLSLWSHFYVERQMYCVILFTFFIKKITKFTYRIWKNIFFSWIWKNDMLNRGVFSLYKRINLILIDFTDFIWFVKK